MKSSYCFHTCLKSNFCRLVLLDYTIPEYLYLVSINKQAKSVYRALKLLEYPQVNLQILNDNNNDKKQVLPILNQKNIKSSIIIFNPLRKL